MVQLFKYKDSEITDILNSIIILIDTREQENSHIKDYFDKKNIAYKVQKLEYGDYSFYIPRNEDLGISRELYFNDVICIERKGSLEELSGNFTKDRARIEEELSRKRGRLYLMIEGATYDDILKHNYNTKYNPKSFIATLKTFEARYDITTSFISKIGSGNYIYYTFIYYLREYLKHGIRN